jgi:hypothetical protein
MRRNRALAIVSCSLCLVTALGAGEARAASLHTIPAPAGLSAIGCMSSALCVVGGSSGLHHTAHVQILRRGRVTRTIVFPGAFVGQRAISCPSARGCVVVLDQGVSGSTLMTIGADGRVSSPRALPQTRRAKFDQISCASISHCELAGQWDIGGDDPIVASWNGSRPGPIYALQTPADSHLVYQVDAELSCGGARCEVSYTFSSAINRAVRLSTVVNGGPPHPVLLPHVHALSVACAANGGCKGALNSPFLGYKSRIGQIINGRLSDDRPSLHIADADLACQINSCLAVGYGVNKSAFVSITGRGVRTPQSVRALSDYLTVAAIPGGGFVAVGEGRPDNQPLLTFINAGSRRPLDQPDT